jgi:hypothetical protein
MTNSIYLPMTIDELIEDFSKYNKEQLYSRYAGNVIRVLLRPKNWKEELYEEYRPDKIVYLTKKYNFTEKQLKQHYQQILRERSKY